MSASSAITLGGLQGIELLCAIVRLFLFYMSGEVTGAIDPLQTGFAVAVAIGACWIFNDPVAPVALLHDRMAPPSVVGTPLFPHEDTLDPCLYRLANHGYHLPPEIENKKTSLRTA
jgi:hypothetical protein